jgi:hypothetical protein
MKIETGWIRAQSWGALRLCDVIRLAARVSVPDCEADPGGAFRTKVHSVVRSVEEVFD